MNFLDVCKLLSLDECEFIVSNLGITYDFCGTRKEIYSRPIPQKGATYPVSPSKDELLGEWETV